MKKVRLIAALAVLGMSAPGLANPPAEAAAPAASSQRMISVTVYGSDACPQGQGDEIVVCARLTESERYRIHKKLRDKRTPPGSESWASRVAYNEDTQRDALPTGCGVLSTTAFGCLAKALREWRGERRMMQSESQP